MAPLTKLQTIVNPRRTEFQEVDALLVGRTPGVVGVVLSEEPTVDEEEPSEANLQDEEQTDEAREGDATDEDVAPPDGDENGGAERAEGAAREKPPSGDGHDDIGGP